MNNQIVHKTGPVLLVGGGDCPENALIRELTQVDSVVAADGGAAHLLRIGKQPDAVYGDMDSLPDALQQKLNPGVLRKISEQDSTDFDKALRHIEAPLVIAHGFMGARVDHQLAAMTVLVRYPDRRCILVGAADIVLVAPPQIVLDLPIGSRFSLYPLAKVTGRSKGLRWPIDGLDMAPSDRVGTSNEVSGPVSLSVSDPVMLLILPVEALPEVKRALAATSQTWPALSR